MQSSNHTTKHLMTYNSQTSIVLHRKHTIFIVTKQAMYVQSNIQARLCNHCCTGKAISITYSECVCVCVFVAWVTQHAMRMVPLYPLLWPVRATQYFPTLSKRLHDLKKKITEHNMCFDFLYKNRLKHFSL